MITSKLQLPSVTVLYLECVPSFDAEAALCGLTGVETLHLSGAVGILKHLVYPISDGNENSHLSSTVKTIVLHQANLDAVSQPGISLVTDRSRRGHPVEKVYLLQCKRVREEYLEGLRRHVSVVEWDGLGLMKVGRPRLLPWIGAVGRKS